MRSINHVARRVADVATVYNRDPFIKGIATILVVCAKQRFDDILVEVHKSGGRMSASRDFLQQGNVIVKWIPPDCPRHMLFGQSAIIVFKDAHIKLDAVAECELDNTLVRARMAKMAGATIENI